MTSSVLKTKFCLTKNGIHISLKITLDRRALKLETEDFTDTTEPRVLTNIPFTFTPLTEFYFFNNNAKE